MLQGLSSCYLYQIIYTFYRGLAILSRPVYRGFPVPSCLPWVSHPMVDEECTVFLVTTEVHKTEVLWNWS